MKHNKFLVVLLIVMVLTMSILAPIQETQAVIPALLVLAEVAPAIIAALGTLIAAGLVVHSDDVALAASKAYVAASGAVGTISDGQLILGATVIAGAKLWLDSWVPTITEATTTTYTQTLGTSVPASSSQSWGTGANVALLSNIAITGDLGLRTMEITGWQGIRDWLSSDPNCVTNFFITAAGMPGFYNIQMFQDYYITQWDGGFAVNMYLMNLADISRIRFSLDLITDMITGLPSLDIGMQYVSDTLGSDWIWEAPMLTHVPPDSISLEMNTNTATETGISANFPLTYGPTDMTYNPTTQLDITIPVPTDWGDVIDKTIEQIANPENPPLEGDPPTTVLDYLHQFWAWLSTFFAWIYGIPDLIAEAILQLNVPLNTEPLRLSGELFTNKFPFSLPWDIQRSVSSLLVTPSFPPINVSFPNPLAPSHPIPFTINVTPFTDVLVPIVRSAFLLMFGISLVWGTRKLLGGAT